MLIEIVFLNRRKNITLICFYEIKSRSHKKVKKVSRRKKY